jgi:serine/threonine protein kinase
MQFDLSGLMTIPQFSREMSLAQAKGLMKQLLTGLAALEERGIMHRDIKGGADFLRILSNRDSRKYPR